MSSGIARGMYLIQNVATERYLFQTGGSITGKRGAEGGWQSSNGFEAPRVVGADINNNGCAYWNIVPQEDNLYIIENQETLRYLFQDGHKTNGEREDEKGWAQAPSVVGTDSNYYNRAYWKIIPQDGDKFLLENFLTGRYLLQNGRKIQGKPGDEGGQSEAPSVVGADAYYCNRAYWKLEKLL